MVISIKCRHFLFKDGLPARHLERTFRSVLDQGLEQGRVLLSDGFAHPDRRLPNCRPQGHERITPVCMIPPFTWYGKVPRINSPTSYS